MRLCRIRYWAGSISVQWLTRVMKNAYSIVIIVKHHTDAVLPVDSILEAVFTVSPNKQYRGIVRPTTPAQHGPERVACIYTLKYKKV